MGEPVAGVQDGPNIDPDYNEDDIPRLPASWHVALWETATVILIILTWASMEYDFYNSTAVGATSIAAATLALVRK